MRYGNPEKDFMRFCINNMDVLGLAPSDIMGSERYNRMYDMFLIKLKLKTLKNKIKTDEKL